MPDRIDIDTLSTMALQDIILDAVQATTGIRPRVVREFDSDTEEVSATLTVTWEQFMALLDPKHLDTTRSAT